MVEAAEAMAIAIEETDRLIASDKVEGTPVFNRKEERLGSVYNFMVDKYTGQVDYAVMAFGGFFGVGARYHPLPWGILGYDTRLGGYVVDLDKETLEQAPSYPANTEPVYDHSYGRHIYDYYGLPSP